MEHTLELYGRFMNCSLYSVDAVIIQFYLSSTNRKGSYSPELLYLRSIRSHIPLRSHTRFPTFALMVDHPLIMLQVCSSVAFDYCVFLFFWLHQHKHSVVQMLVTFFPLPFALSYFHCRFFSFPILIHSLSLSFLHSFFLSLTLFFSLLLSASLSLFQSLLCAVIFLLSSFYSPSILFLFFLSLTSKAGDAMLFWYFFLYTFRPN